MIGVRKFVLFVLLLQFACDLLCPLGMAVCQRCQSLVTRLYANIASSRLVRQVCLVYSHATSIRHENGKGYGVAAYVISHVGLLLMVICSACCSCDCSCWVEQLPASSFLVGFFRLPTSLHSLTRNLDQLSDHK